MELANGVKIDNPNGVQLVALVLTDAMAERLLTICEADKESWQDAAEHVFELGVNSRENTIKANAKRKADEIKAKSMDALTNILKMNPAIAGDNNLLLNTLKGLGIKIPDAPKTDEQTGKAPEQPEAAASSAAGA